MGISVIELTKIKCMFISESMYLISVQNQFSQLYLTSCIDTGDNVPSPSGNSLSFNCLSSVLKDKYDDVLLPIIYHRGKRHVNNLCVPVINGTILQTLPSTSISLAAALIS